MEQSEIRRKDRNLTRKQQAIDVRRLDGMNEGFEHKSLSLLVKPTGGVAGNLKPRGICQMLIRIEVMDPQQTESDLPGDE